MNDILVTPYTHAYIVIYCKYQIVKFIKDANSYRKVQNERLKPYQQKPNTEFILPTSRTKRTQIADGTQCSPLHYFCINLMTS